MSSLLLSMTDDIALFESTTHDLEGFLKEVSHAEPDLILLEESSPFSAEALLVRVLIAKPGTPVIVISQENNWIHVVRRQTVRLRSANDLIDAMKLN